MAIGSLTLSPTFDPNTYTYSANTTNATDSLTVTAVDAGATVVTKLNGTAFTGSTITWTASTDVLTIEVTAGSVSKTYTVTVTHTP